MINEGYESLYDMKPKTVYVTHDSRRVKGIEGEVIPSTWSYVDLCAIPHSTECCIKFVNINVKHKEGYIPDQLSGFISVEPSKNLRNVVQLARGKCFNNIVNPDPWILHFPLVEPAATKLQTNICYTVNWPLDDILKVALSDKNLVPIEVDALVFTIQFTFMYD